MTISIENREGSGIALLEMTSGGVDSTLVPFCFPLQKVSLSEGTRKYLVRVPLVESSDGRSLISLERAREAIPTVEAMGKELDAYVIESLSEGQGGTVNGVKVELGTPVEDLGITYTAG